MKQWDLKFILLFFFSFVLNCYHSKPNDDLSNLLLGNSQMQRVTIVGDSLSEWSRGFGLREKLPANFTVTNLSAAGFSVRDWLERQSILLSNPTETWIVFLGTNDGYLYGNSTFEENYRALLAILQLNLPRNIIVSTLPLTNDAGLKLVLRDFNHTLRKIQKETTNSRLVDLEKAFSNAVGDLPLYPLDDPIHPNQIGYELIGEAYRQCILGICN